MSSVDAITFVVASLGIDNTLETNLLASPCFRAPHLHQILVQRSFPSAALAYNHAIDSATNDLLVFAHEDIIFPAPWLSQLERALKYIQQEDPNWGVLGCYGVTRDQGGRGHVYSPHCGIIGKPFANPVPVQTLDEIVLILRKSSGLRFDDHLPHFHLYGTDICLRAAQKGMRSYAISALCIHNHRYYVVLPKEFYECSRYIKRAWAEFLPIQTSCTMITRSDLGYFKQRLRGAIGRYTRPSASEAPRLNDVSRLLKHVDAISEEAVSSTCSEIPTR